MGGEFFLRLSPCTSCDPSSRARTIFQIGATFFGTSWWCAADSCIFPRESG